MFCNLTLPYQFGTMVGADPSHRLIVLVPTFQAMGVAVGPVFAGVVIERFGFGMLWVAAAVPLVLYAVCILPFTRARRGRHFEQTDLNSPAGHRNEGDPAS